MPLFLLPLLLTGCAAQDYLKQEYTNAPVQTVRTSRDSFGVWDKGGKLLVLPQADRGSGFIVNLAMTQYPQPFFREAAEAYLVQSGRRCTVSDGAMILEQRWEFSYQCAA